MTLEELRGIYASLGDDNAAGRVIFGILIATLEPEEGVQPWGNWQRNNRLPHFTPTPWEVVFAPPAAAGKGDEHSEL